MHADAFYRHPGDREGGLAGPFALAVALHLLVALLFWVAWWWSPQRQVEPAAGSPVIEASLVMSASDIAAAQRRAEDAAGEHHFAHAARANDLGHAHRSATTDVDSVAAFGQLVNRAGFGHPDVGGGGQFQPASDHGALHGGDHRDAAVLDAGENTVP